MKRIFMFAMLICMGLCFTGCRWLVCPAEPTIVGVGQIWNDNGLYVVEINSVKFAPQEVYTNRNNIRSVLKDKMDPIEGMVVTAFTLDDDKRVQFIAGDVSKERLAEFFGRDFRMFFWMVVGLLGATSLVALLEKKGKRH